MTVALTGLKGTGAEVVGDMIVVVMTVEAMKEVAEDHPPVWGKCVNPWKVLQRTLCVTCMKQLHRSDVTGLCWYKLIFNNLSK